MLSSFKKLYVIIQGMTGYLKNKKKGTINSYLSAIAEKKKKD